MIFLLCGRIFSPATPKELPSRDRVVEFGLIISRKRGDGVDTLDIAAWSPRSRPAALTLKSDEWIKVSGSLHRRFWKGATGPASRWQVEALEIARI